MGFGFEDQENTGVQEGGNFTLNLNDVDENAGGFEVLAKGDYEAIVDEVEYGTSKKGAPMLTWKFKLTDTEPKRTMFYYTVLNQQFGIAALKKTIINLRLDVDMAKFNPQEFADQGDAIGMPIKVKIGIQKYEGEKRNNVKETAPSTAGEEFI